MRLQFRTSIGSASRSFIEGQSIDVPARTKAEFEAWLAEEPEFRGWIAQGVVVILSGPPGVEVAQLDPLVETATLPHPRQSRGRGRGKPPFVSRAVPA